MTLGLGSIKMCIKVSCMHVGVRARGGVGWVGVHRTVEGRWLVCRHASA